MVVVADHESRVLARRTFRRRAWELGAALDWAAARGDMRVISQDKGGASRTRTLPTAAIASVNVQRRDA